MIKEVEINKKLLMSVQNKFCLNVKMGPNLWKNIVKFDPNFATVKKSWGCLVKLGLFV